MSATKLGAETVKQAAWFITPDDMGKLCLEVGNNRGACITDLQKQFYGNERNEWYCTIFAWLMIDNASKSVGVKNILLKNANGTLIINDAVKKGIREDRTPAVGSMFRHKKGGTSGHTGIVAWVDGNYWYTIEGNGGEVNVNGKSYQGIFSYKYSKSKIQSDNYYFLHAEEMGNTGNVSFNVNPLNKYGFYVNAANVSSGFGGLFSLNLSTKAKYLLGGGLLGAGLLVGYMKFKK